MSPLTCGALHGLAVARKLGRQGRRSWPRDVAHSLPTLTPWLTQAGPEQPRERRPIPLCGGKLRDPRAARAIPWLAPRRAHLAVAPIEERKQRRRCFDAGWPSPAIDRASVGAPSRFEIAHDLRHAAATVTQHNTTALGENVNETSAWETCPFRKRGVAGGGGRDQPRRRRDPEKGRHLEVRRPRRAAELRWSPRDHLRPHSPDRPVL